ncbi:MAG: class III lanthionine synthetase LanKC [Trueperaceae bacterium]
MIIKIEEGSSIVRELRHVERLSFLSNSPYFEPFESTYEPNNEYTKRLTQICEKYDLKMFREGFWVHCISKDSKFISQGWKIHVSATVDNAIEILEYVANTLIPRGTPFKFIADRRGHIITNRKNYSRAGSGKFITIYPENDQDFQEILEELYVELKDKEGPYILSDKRYRDSKVLYYRYGGIQRKTILNYLGEQVHVIYSPDGEVVPDVRKPYFKPPSWVTDPFAKPQENDPVVPTLKNGQYSILTSFAFSNTGGVYLARDNQNGRKVVIKEARPYTSMDNDGNEAVSILRREFEVLRLLKNTRVAPEPIEMFQEWEHHYLVEEYIEGANIREMILGKNPLIKLNPSLEDTQKFFDYFCRIFGSFNEVLKAVHSIGIVLGDLSPENFVIDRDTCTVRIIDLEGAFKLNEEKPTYLYTPGFRRHQSVIDKTQGFNDDLYTLATIMAHFIFPVSLVAEVKKDFFTQVLDIVLKDIGWPEQLYKLINGLIEETKNYDDIKTFFEKPLKLHKPSFSSKVETQEVKNMVKRFGEFLLHVVEPNKDSRLFPGDPFMYQTNPLGFGLGASGILFALKKCGFEIADKAMTWLDKKVNEVNNKTLPAGVFTGTSGLAYALWELGCEDSALTMIELANKHPLLEQNHSLYYGMAGVGLTNLFMYQKTKDVKFVAAAKILANQLLKTVIRDEKGCYWKDEKGKVWLGYGYGQSGVASFLHKLSQGTNEKSYLDLGKEAIAYDLAYAYPNELGDGTFSFPGSITDTHTYSSYLENGTAGIVKVLSEYKMYDELTKLVDDLNRKYAVGIGLSWGLTGFVAVLTKLFQTTKETKYLQMCQRPLAGIRDLYLIETTNGFAIPGEGFYRITCDYATGVAGVMHTFHKYFNAKSTLDENSNQQKELVHA